MQGSAKRLNVFYERGMFHSGLHAGRLATLEKGKFADIIAVSGNPLADVSELEGVHFVMKAAR